MLKKLFKTGVTAAAGWVGNAIGGDLQVELLLVKLQTVYLVEMVVVVVIFN